MFKSNQPLQIQPSQKKTRLQKTLEKIIGFNHVGSPSGWWFQLRSGHRFNGGEGPVAPKIPWFFRAGSRSCDYGCIFIYIRIS